MKKVCNNCGQGHLEVPKDARPQLSFDNTGVEGYLWECKGFDGNGTCNSTLFLRTAKVFKEDAE